MNERLASVQVRADTRAALWASLKYINPTLVDTTVLYIQTDDKPNPYGRYYVNLEVNIDPVEESENAEV